MKTFQQYIAESVEATKRTGMLHLNKMKDLEFIDWVRSIQSQFKGKLENIKVSLKVDGGGYRMGLDKSGRPFVEGSRTGPIFEPRAFSTHAKNKGGSPEIVARAMHYDDMFEIITKSKFIKTLPKDSKVICEMFYNPMAEVTDAGLKFVSITYDKTKLGSMMTIIPFEVVVASTGHPHPDSEKIIKGLLSQSNDKIKFVDPKLNTSGTIDISGMIDPILSLNSDMIAALSSRKKVDADTKAAAKATVQAVKDQVSRYILDHPAIVGKDMLGPEMEGLVLDIDGRIVKVTTDAFKASKVK